MPIMLGNLDVSNIEKRLGITLKENDRETLISMRQNDAPGHSDWEMALF